MVLNVDEKAQFQALDRTQPGLPMKNDGAEPHSVENRQADIWNVCFRAAFGLGVGLLELAHPDLGEVRRWASRMCQTMYGRDSIFLRSPLGVPVRRPTKKVARPPFPLFAMTPTITVPRS
ncbi:hypothetical protein IP69_04320 [Bosea sp. AAP35]|nr:hypothetical protein IP69_04320 [Bosea sp. AAP35]